jgi:hypothetical protein
VEAPGIEPGSENFEATCVYVRIRPFVSSQFARAGALALGLSTCLISPPPRWPGAWLASLLTASPGHWQALGSAGSQDCCLGSESNCVIVRNCVSRRVFTWFVEPHGTQQSSRNLRRSRSPPIGERLRQPTAHRPPTQGPRPPLRAVVRSPLERDLDPHPVAVLQEQGVGAVELLHRGHLEADARHRPRDLVHGRA